MYYSRFQRGFSPICHTSYDKFLERTAYPTRNFWTAQKFFREAHKFPPTANKHIRQICHTTYGNISLISSRRRCSPLTMIKRRKRTEVFMQRHHSSTVLVIINSHGERRDHIARETVTREWRNRANRATLNILYICLPGRFHRYRNFRLPAGRECRGADRDHNIMRAFRRPPSPWTTSLTVRATILGIQLNWIHSTSRSQTTIDYRLSCLWRASARDSIVRARTRARVIRIVILNLDQSASARDDTGELTRRESSPLYCASYIARPITRVPRQA